MKLLRGWLTKLLQWSSRNTSSDRREWIEAMLAECAALRSDREAVKWTLGCVVASLQMLVRRSTFRQRPRGAAEGSRAMFRYYATAVLVVLAVLFVFTSVVREGLEMSAQSWRRIGFASDQHDRETVLKNPKSSSDPSALAYIALTSDSPAEAERYGADSVRRDANQTWVYALLAARFPDAGQAQSWTQELVQWDATNSYVHLIAAHVMCAGKMNREDCEIPAWNERMKQAFAAERYDDYLLSRLKLQQHIIKQYGAADPSTALRILMQYPLLLGDWIRYGRKLAQGTDRADLWSAVSAAQKLWAGSETDLERFAALEIMKRATPKLQHQLAEEGSIREASLIASALSGMQQTQSELLKRDELGRLHSAPVVHVMSLITASSAVALLAIFSIAIFRRAQGRETSWWKSSAGTTLAVLLTASAGVYVGYRPYHELYSRFAGGAAVSPWQLQELFSMYSVPWMYVRVSPEYVLRVWGWYGVIGVCLVTLLAIGMRHVPKTKHV